MTTFNNFDIDFLGRNSFNSPTFDSLVNRSVKMEDQNLGAIFADRFTDRESYKAFRAEWKAAYKDLSAQIRYCKSHRKQRISGNMACHFASDAMMGRYYAHRMMDYLELAKARAGQLRQAEIDAREAA